MGRAELNLCRHKGVDGYPPSAPNGRNRATGVDAQLVERGILNSGAAGSIPANPIQRRTT